jgi:hypothetical protein
MHFLLFFLLTAYACAADIASLAQATTHLESLRRIKSLQRTLSHRLQFGLPVTTLFAPNATFVWSSTNTSLSGARAISHFFATQSADGAAPGSLNTLIAENPVISLSADGTRAQGRWNGMWFQGTGAGETRIQGGIYENTYALTSSGWRISELRYHGLYEGTYEDGWRNVGLKGIPIVPYHFTAKSSGVPIQAANGGDAYNGTMGELAARIERLNSEDEVRNLVHAHGYYVDRRMWSDVVDLHAHETTATVAGEVYRGKEGVRRVLERMGPEGLTQGINNDHPIFGLLVRVNGSEAMTRGMEIAMIGDANTGVARWEFNVLRFGCVREEGVWKVKDVEITPLVVADYYEGWGNGGARPPNTYIPPFLEFEDDYSPQAGSKTNLTVEDLERRLRRSEDYDGSENQSHAYGYLLDDLQAVEMGALFAKKGHKASPFAGFFQTPERITQANIASYGNNRSALRSGVSFHWRPQPVILVSEDGRSATVRARLLQPSTSITKAGSFNSAMYHDQVVLEDGKWRLWSVTIDEFYWQSSSWKEGWANAKPCNGTAPNPEPAGWTKKYPPDITLADVGERESTFRGGSGRYIEWPEIQRMWFQYRNPVSGRVPEWYWPGCVPCQVRKDWSLEANGYEEPNTGPRQTASSINRLDRK